MAAARRVNCGEVLVGLINATNVLRLICPPLARGFSPSSLRSPRRVLFCLSSFGVAATTFVLSVRGGFSLSLSALILLSFLSFIVAFKVGLMGANVRRSDLNGFLSSLDARNFATSPASYPFPSCLDRD